VAQFTNANIIGPNFESDGVPKISAGQYAVITINVEKLGKNKIDDILIKSYVENPDSNQFLYIENKKIHPGHDVYDFDIVDERVVRDKTDPFGGKDTTGPVMIKVIATGYPQTESAEIINVVLFADGQEMDRHSFDVIVNSRF